MPTPNTTTRLLAVACALALATSTAACGDNDDDTSNGGSADASPQSADRTDASQAKGGDDGGATGSTSGEPASDENQIKALVANVSKAMKASDGDTVCASFTDAGRRDFLAYGETIGFPGGCPKVIDGIARYNKQAGLDKTPDPKVVTVRVRGNQATALIRPAGGAPLRQRFTKADGQWLYQPWQLAKAVGATTTP
jgi:hypothetical protein